MRPDSLLPLDGQWFGHDGARYRPRVQLDCRRRLQRESTCIRFASTPVAPGRRWYITLVALTHVREAERLVGGRVIQYSVGIPPASPPTPLAVARSGLEINHARWRSRRLEVDRARQVTGVEGDRRRAVIADGRARGRRGFRRWVRLRGPRHHQSGKRQENSGRGRADDCSGKSVGSGTNSHCRSRYLLSEPRCAAPNVVD